jgi:outer membrane biosynthesis protein TonB
MPPLAGLGHGLQGGRKPTPHAPPSPVEHGPGGAASKLPPPSGVHPVLAARGAAERSSGDPSSLLETPAPMPHMVAHAHGTKTNGVGASGTHAPPRPVNSDVLQMLNLPGGTQTAPGAPPRLLSLTETMAATGVAPPAPRSRSAMYIVGLLGVIGVVVVLVVVNLKKPTKPPAVVVQQPPVTAPVEPVVEKPVEQPPPVVAPVEQPPPVTGKGKRAAKATRAVVNKTTPAPATTTAIANAPAGGGDAARFRDNHTLNITGGGIAARPPPAQADITKVISNNRAGIKVCYQRALTRDNSLTHGKLAVKLSIGISGRVKHVGLDGPTQFKLLLEPCIKDVVQRWVFPQASEEYGTEFPLVFQGNE